MISNTLKVDIKFLLSNLCEENEFVLANFYVPSGPTKDPYLTCKDWPCYVEDDDPKLLEFQKFCTEQKYSMGEEVLGEVCI